MERNITSEAIVLKSRRWGELHRRITLLSPSLGLFDATVYGGQKGKLAGLIEPFIVGNYYIYHNPSKKEYSIKDVQLIETLEEIKKDLKHLYIANAMAELTLKVHGGDFKELYNLLKLHLGMLKEFEYRKVFIQYVWRLIKVMGLESDLLCCPLCGKNYQEEEIVAYNEKMHTVCCFDCKDVFADDYGILLPPGSRRYLLFTENLSVQSALSVELNERTTERLFRYMIRSITNIVGSNIQSLASDIFR
jgi:DNA repair protein RecO (recombination protein O)